MYVELSSLRTARRKVTEAIRAVEEASSNELELLITFRRAPSGVYNRTSARQRPNEITERDGVHLIAPRPFHDLFDPVKEVILLIEETVADVGKADCLKDPEHSSGGPAVTGRPEVIVLVRAKFDVPPQVG